MTHCTDMGILRCIVFQTWLCTWLFCYLCEDTIPYPFQGSVVREKHSYFCNTVHCVEKVIHLTTGNRRHGRDNDVAMGGKFSILVNYLQFIAKPTERSCRQHHLKRFLEVNAGLIWIGCFNFKAKCYDQAIAWVAGEFSNSWARFLFRWQRKPMWFIRLARHTGVRKVSNKNDYS